MERGVLCTDGDSLSFHAADSRITKLSCKTWAEEPKPPSLPCACHREARQSQVPVQERKGRELTSPMHREIPAWHHSKGVEGSSSTCTHVKGNPSKSGTEGKEQTQHLGRNPERQRGSPGLQCTGMQHSPAAPCSQPLR